MKGFISIFAVLAFSVLLFGCLNSSTPQSTASEVTQTTQQTVPPVNEAELPADDLTITSSDVEDVNPDDYDKLN